jgi:molybdopterin-guanine dinucleotide biosynthesis protein A
VRFEGCTLALIAGGRAERLGGVVKAHLHLGDGRTVLRRTLEVIGPLVEEVLVAGGDPRDFPGLRCVPDFYAERGAPGGLHAALLGARTDWVLALGSDMPQVRPEVLEVLWSRRMLGDAVAAELARGPELLHAFWRVSCVHAVERVLDAGDASMRRIASAVGLVGVSEAEVRAVDPELASFANVNTPEDAARLGIRAG